MINFCIHGHFYQPPRENPWIGKIELQESASPYHNWNEKIYNECYLPVTEAKILKDEEITDEVNIFEYINFNIGPTLFSWLLENHPDTSEKIIKADSQSIQKHNGHGNAIAQAFNHIIMPLANDNDKITQIRWGLKYFEHYFNRKSEGLWLPETACNQSTIEALISERVKYTILDTSQASAFREQGSEMWYNVQNTGVSPLVAYKCYSEKDKDKFINIIFYDGPLSRSVAFENTLITSEVLLLRILNLIPEKKQDDKLISIATDGETFGHHKINAERTLAYLLKYLLPKYELNLVNFGEYLERFQPNYEVKLKSGLNDEGTSWSCPHGISRWKDDCGCGGGEWHQRWRKQLREALDWLRDKLITLTEVTGNKYMYDIWAARNDYIRVILDDSDKNKNLFFENHSKIKLNEYKKNICICLLEMQKYAMMMYTSCGWFFSEISGIETVQILKYAKKSMELARLISGYDFETEFISRLEKAESNLPEYGNGKTVYEKLVKPLHP